MPRNKCSKFYHLSMVYLPVVLILGIIALIYSSYILIYLKELINTPETSLNTNFFLYYTSNSQSARSKGLGLLYATIFFVIMLLLSFFKTVFSNPGFFPSPLELEHKMINRKKTYNRPDTSISTELTRMPEEEKKNCKEISFFSKLSEAISSGPLTSLENVDIRNSIVEFFPKNNPKIESPYSNDEIFEENKKRYIEEFPEYQNDSCCLLAPRDPDLFIHIYKGVDLSKTTLCGTCLRIKVERSHHCRQCGRCILKMDHHCPWLANCIGFGNYKAFCLLHFYGLISTSIIALTFWEVVVNYNLNYDSNLGDCWFVASVYILNLGLLCFLAWLFCLNVHLLYTGQTVIESSDRQRFPSSKSLNIYDMGPYRNFTNVFGTNPLVWFIPFLHNKKGMGYVFETKEFKLNN